MVLSETELKPRTRQGVEKGGKWFSSVPSIEISLLKMLKDSYTFWAGWSSISAARVVASALIVASGVLRASQSLMLYVFAPLQVLAAIQDTNQTESHTEDPWQI